MINWTETGWASVSAYFGYKTAEPSQASHLSTHMHRPFAVMFQCLCVLSSVLCTSTSPEYQHRLRTKIQKKAYPELMTVLEDSDAIEPPRPQNPTPNSASRQLSPWLLADPQALSERTKRRSFDDAEEEKQDEEENEKGLMPGTFDPFTRRHRHRHSFRSQSKFTQSHVASQFLQSAPETEHKNRQKAPTKDTVSGEKREQERESFVPLTIEPGSAVPIPKALSESTSSSARHSSTLQESLESSTEASSESGQTPPKDKPLQERVQNEDRSPLEELNQLPLDNQSPHNATRLVAEGIPVFRDEALRNQRNLLIVQPSVHSASRSEQSSSKRRCCERLCRCLYRNGRN